MSSSDGKPTGFTINDRRSFVSSDAQPQAGEAEAAEAPPPQTQAAPKPEAPSRILPPVDFSTFVVSIGSSALMHLGETDPGAASKNEPDLEMAKHTIDILSMLEVKTKGNLNAPEEQLLESLLYELRLRYVEALKAKNAAR